MSRFSFKKMAKFHKFFNEFFFWGFRWNISTVTFCIYLAHRKFFKLGNTRVIKPGNQTWISKLKALKTLKRKQLNLKLYKIYQN